MSSAAGPGHLEDQRTQFLRSSICSKISEVDFSDKFDDSNNSESNNDNRPGDTHSSSVAVDSRPSNGSSNGGRPSNGSSHYDPRHTEQSTATTEGRLTTEEGRVTSFEEQMESMNNEIARNRISTPVDEIDNSNRSFRRSRGNDDVGGGIGELCANLKDTVRDHISPERRKRWRMWYKQRIRPFRWIILAQIGCVIYILVATFSYPIGSTGLGLKDPETGNIIDTTSAENTANGVIMVNGDYRPVVAEGGWQKFCLAMSRMSAFSMYPMIVIVFFTKMKALQTFFTKTPLSMYFAMITEGHDYHVYAGRYIAFDIWIHTAFHLLRWLSQGNLELLGTSAAGQTGMIAICVTPLITFPMMYFKRKGCALLRPYEIRKAMHYLFYVFAVALCWHVPFSAIPNGGFLGFVLSISIGLYTLDTFYVNLFMCEKIETTKFNVLSSGVMISMPVSERFQRQAFHARNGFAYINLPWVDNKQWHPFSLFEDPNDPSVQEMFLMKSGDWTKAVHSALARDTTRPVWIKGPFPSPFGHASSYDNQILVASGIGITPALGAISAFKSTRRVNLIWAVRDPEMLEFFMEKMYLEHSGWNLIFYTGKKALKPDIYNSNTNIKVVKGRPKLDSVIPNIIYGIESGEGLPEKYTASAKTQTAKQLSNLIHELDQDRSLSATAKVHKIKAKSQELGFSLASDIESPRGADDNDAKRVLGALRSSIKSQSIGGDLRASGQLWSNVMDGIDAERSDALDMDFCPWIPNKSQEKCVKRYSEDIMQTWGIMYCGGSPPVIDSLQGISLKYHIDVHIDSFAW